MRPGFTRERAYLVCDNSGIVAICTYIAGAKAFADRMRAENEPEYKVFILEQTKTTAREPVDY